MNIQLPHIIRLNGLCITITDESRTRLDEIAECISFAYIVSNAALRSKGRTKLLVLAKKSFIEKCLGENFSQREIADYLNVHQSTINKHIHRKNKTA